MQYRTTDTSDPGPIYTGRRVLDEHGLPLGTVTDVVYESDDYEPLYLVVDPGLLRRAHYLPAAGAWSSTNHQLAVRAHGPIIVTAPRE